MTSYSGKMDVRFILNADTVGSSFWSGALGNNDEMTATLSRWAEKLQADPEQEQIGNTVAMALDTLEDDYSEDIYIQAGGHVVTLYARNGQWRLGSKGLEQGKTALAEIRNFIDSINK